MSRGLRLPADEFLWAVLPAGGPQVVEPLPFRFERHLPMPIESVQCAFVQVPDGRTVAAALPVARLQELRRDPGWLAVRAVGPDSLPIALQGLDLPQDCWEALNLLHGAWESEPRRRSRRVVRGAILVGLLLVEVAVLVVGQWSMAAQNRAIEDVLERTEARALQVLNAHGAPPSSLPVSARLVQASRAAQVDSRSAGRMPDDVTVVLDRLWGAWPSSAGLRLSSVHAGPGRIQIAADAQDRAGLSQTLAALQRVEVSGVIWELQPSGFNGARDSASVTLEWVPSQEKRR